jgi:hypothetical protein
MFMQSYTVFLEVLKDIFEPFFTLLPYIYEGSKLRPWNIFEGVSEQKTNGRFKGLRTFHEYLWKKMISETKPA